MAAETKMDVEESAPQPAVDHQDPSADVDLAAYISKYTGYTRLKRLVYIGESCPGLQGQAYRMAIDMAKSMNDTQMYTKLVSSVGSYLGEGSVTLDSSWVDETDRANASRQETLDLNLGHVKSTMVKEGIRVAYTDLGNFYYAKGDIQSALKNFLRTRDYCTTPAHTSDMCINVITASSDLGHWRHVSQYVSKGEQMEAPSPEYTSKLRAASGLTSLAEGEMKIAARRFLTVEESLGNTFSNVITLEDVATYGTLCALASLDRQELRRRLFENATFQVVLEAVPTLRALAQDFFYGRYGSCIERLHAMLPILMIDMYMRPHAVELVESIKESLALQYFSPYLSVDLRRMAAAFNQDVQDMEKVVCKLIAKDALPARIDSESKTMHRRGHDERHASVDKVMRLMDAHVRQTNTALLRLSLMQHDFVITAADDTRQGSSRDLSGAAEIEVPEDNRQDGSM